MSSITAQLTAVRSADPELRRRGRTLILLSLGMTVLALLFIPLVLSTGNLVGLITLLVGAALFVGTAYLGRLGHVTAGAALLIGVTAAAILASIPSTSSTPNTGFYLVLPLLLAGVLLPPVHVWSVMALIILGAAPAYGMLPAAVRADPLYAQAAQGVPLLLLMVALISFLSAREVGLALREAARARSEAEAASAGLAEANAALEERVAERTAELRLAADEQRATAAALRESLADRERLDQAILELSVPVIPLSDDTLVVPLVGALDSGRIGRLSGEVLERVGDARARTVILDVTGVPVVDTQVAAALLQVAAAARLMGASTILCGIRPEVAQALVQLGADLTGLRSAATLRDGLGLARYREGGR